MYIEQRWKIFLGIIYLIIAAYLLNLGFIFIDIPDIIRKVDKWIFIVAGCFLIFAGLKNFGRSYQ